MNDRCPEGCGAPLVEDVMEVVNNGKCPHDPDATFDEVDSLRCPSCGYEVEAEAMLPAFVRKDGREAPSEKDPQFDPFHDESLAGVGR